VLCPGWGRGIVRSAGTPRPGDRGYPRTMR
jgi:hypothetical protein